MVVELACVPPHLYAFGRVFLVGCSVVSVLLALPSLYFLSSQTALSGDFRWYLITLQVRSRLSP